MGTDPGKAERQDETLDGAAEGGEADEQQHPAQNQAAAINQQAPGRKARGHYAQD